MRKKRRCRPEGPEERKGSEFLKGPQADASYDGGNLFNA